MVERPKKIGSGSVERVVHDEGPMMLTEEGWLVVDRIAACRVRASAWGGSAWDVDVLVDGDWICVESVSAETEAKDLQDRIGGKLMRRLVPPVWVEVPG